MDAYSVSSTDPAKRGSSKIYQDLLATGFHTLSGPQADQVLEKSGTMDLSPKV